jgi:cytochrome c553
MKTLLGSIALLGCVALLLVGTHLSPAAAAALLASKTEPKEVILSKNSKDPKAKPVYFSHEAHATQAKYSADGKAAMSCAECHHTDQPKTGLTGVLKTSERDVLLTSKNLQDAGAAPVKGCHECHSQAGVKPTGIAAVPTVKYPDEDDETTLTNDEAFHRNCAGCHDAVKKRDPATKAPGSNKCAECHNGGTKPA